MIVGKEGVNGLEVSELHCTFQIEKSMSDTPNHSTVKIYNLAPQSRNTILEEGSRIIIEAGYQNGPYGLIYDGDLIQTLRYTEDGVTEVMELIAQDGDIFLNKGFISVTYGAGQTAQSILSGLAEAGGQPMELGYVSPDLSQTKLTRGKVLFGQPKQYARKMAHGEGALFYVNDRKIHMVKPSDLPDGEIISLSPSSGLVGMPELTDDGIKTKCLLNPLLNINKQVYIDNGFVQSQKAVAGSGVYKVLTLTHTGDTRGQDWYTEFTGVAQPGTIPLTGKSYTK